MHGLGHAAACSETKSSGFEPGNGSVNLSACASDGGELGSIHGLVENWRAMVWNSSSFQTRRNANDNEGIEMRLAA